jgi:hypothetical protein
MILYARPAVAIDPFRRHDFSTVAAWGVRSVVAESVFIKAPTPDFEPRPQTAPNLRALDRVIFGFCSLLVKLSRLVRTAIALKPVTFLNFHRALVQRKYQLLFSPKERRKPGPKVPMLT